MTINSQIAEELSNQLLFNIDNLSRSDINFLKEKKALHQRLCRYFLALLESHNKKLRKARKSLSETRLIIYPIQKEINDIKKALEVYDKL